MNHKKLIPLIAIALALSLPATAYAKAPCASDKPAQAFPTTVTQVATAHPSSTSTTVKATSSSTSTSTTIKEKPCQTSTTLRTNAVPTTTVPKSTTTVKPAGAVVTSSTSTSLPQDDSINRYGTDAIGVAVEAPQIVTASSTEQPALALTGAQTDRLMLIGSWLVVIGGFSGLAAWFLKLRRQIIEGKTERFES